MAAFTGGLVDWQWQSEGDLLLSGGDIATTDPIGADLAARLGDTIDAELNITLRRQVNNSLTNQFLPRGSFLVTSLQDNGTITVFVYINQSLIASAVLNTQTGVQTII